VGGRGSECTEAAPEEDLADHVCGLANGLCCDRAAGVKGVCVAGGGCEEACSGL
jgi:hypothetical protein